MNNIMRVTLLVVVSFLLFLLPKCKNGTGSDSDDIDTTSHSFTWQFDTIGIYGSSLRDVAIIDQSNIWAVGEIRTNETDTFDSLGNMIAPYNIVQWNGEKSILDRAEFYYRGNIINHGFYGIFAFSNKNIWASVGIPVKWDGIQWTLNHLWDMGILKQSDGSVRRIWGQSVDNIYFIGNLGTIVNYKNQTWERIESGTSIDLVDISGRENMIIIAGYHYTGPSIVLFYDSQNWDILFESSSYYGNPEQNDYGRTSAVSFIEDKAFIASKSGLHIFNPENNQHVLIPASEAKMIGHDIIKICGTAKNDIILASRGGMIIHFNGKTWKKLSDIYDLFGTGELTFNSCSFKNNTIVAVGYYGSLQNAIIVQGVRD